MLAVLAVGDPSGTTLPAPEMQPFTSQVAADRVYDAIVPPPVPPDRWVTGRMLPGFGDPVVVALPEVTTGATTLVRGYDVSYTQGRCFADIALTGVADHTYAPLVQLAIARYQPQSLDGLALSPVVTTDFLPLLPDRRLIVERLADGLQVTLNGIGPANSDGRPNRVDAHLEQLDAPSGVPVDTVDLAALGPDAGGLPAWIRIAGMAVSGELGSPLPILAAPGGAGRFRLVIKEVERFFGDDLGTVVEPPAGGDLTEHIVFTDIINLT
jgi:hypothetical protein